MTDDQRLSPAERDQLLYRVDERVKKISETTKENEQHLRKINGTIADTCVKLAKAGEIAQEAKERAISNRSYIDKMVIALIATGLAALAGIASAIIQGING